MGKVKHGIIYSVADLGIEFRKSGSKAPLWLLGWRWAKKKKKPSQNFIWATVFSPIWRKSVYKYAPLQVSFGNLYQSFGFLFCLLRPPGSEAWEQPRALQRDLHSRRVWAGCLATWKTVWIFHQEISIDYFREMNTYPLNTLGSWKHNGAHSLSINPFPVTCPRPVIASHPSFS